MNKYSITLRERDIPEEKKRCLFIMKWKEPIIAMRIENNFHTFSLGEMNNISFHVFREFMSGVEKWCYLSDLDKVGEVWHV